MGNRLGYLLMLLWETRVGYLLLLALYSISSSLSRMPRIISSEPKSTRSATLISTTTCRNIWVGEEVLLSSKTLHLAGTRKLRARFVGPFRVLERVGRQPTDWISGGDSKMSIISSTYPSLGSTSHGGSSENPPEPIQVEGEEHFEFEALLQHRSRGKL